MAQITIKLAKATDKDSIVDFIEQHWKRDHIFVKNRIVFDWQYSRAFDDCNFVIAERFDANGVEILGVLGFIPFGRFDPKLSMDDISLALWKVKETGAPPGLGLRLLRFIETNLKPKRILAIGISDYVEPMYKVLGYTVSRLEHGAFFNPDFQDNLIVAKYVPATAYKCNILLDEFQLTWLSQTDVASLSTQFEALFLSQLPVKSISYLQSRFFNHPWYKYQIYGVFKGTDLRSCFVVRKLTVLDRQVLRIVDFIGPINSLGNINNAIIDMLREQNAEYMDFMSYGSSSVDLTATGYIWSSEHLEMILPNYFSPFEQSNINVKLAYKSFDATAVDKPIRLNRADSDQDRPNSQEELDGL